MMKLATIALCLGFSAASVTYLTQSGTRFGDTRSGNPDQVNTFTYVSNVNIPAGKTINLRYKYVAGYCSHGTSEIGAQFAVKIGGIQIPLMAAGPFSGSSTTDYPYDTRCGGCPTCYSPWVDLSGTTTSAMSGDLEITFTNNGRNMHLVVDHISETDSHTPAPTASPTWSAANLRDNSDASISPLKLAHDEYRTNTKTSRIAAEVNYKKYVVELTKTFTSDHFFTHGAKKRYNNLLVEDSLKPIAEQALAGKTPYPESELGNHGKKVSQGRCPATVPAFANGVNGAKVVGKGPHGAHDENQSGSIVPVDCADGFAASPEGSNPLVFIRCEPNAVGDTYTWVMHGSCNPTSTSHMVVCGSSHYCIDAPRLADDDEKHEVRCCSDVAHTGYSQNSVFGCAVWGGSEIPTCIHSATYAEAKAHCLANGARLCTQAELISDCTRGSGCSHDTDMIWSMTSA
jgi:hypothetical protein